MVLGVHITHCSEACTPFAASKDQIGAAVRQAVGLQRDRAKKERQVKARQGNPAFFFLHAGIFAQGCKDGVTLEASSASVLQDKYKVGEPFYENCS